MSKNNFDIYNASAGSGKTFTLVKIYLTLLFKTNSNLNFKNILAITFTNKAVGEMKTRIISTLKEFANEDVVNKDNHMFNEIVKELKKEPKEIITSSKAILQTILHNYAALNVSTIDGFNHNLIRTFAHDLKLPVNFEVELDTRQLITKAVERVIAQAGKNKTLTKTLVDFALEKADDDKNWNFSRELLSIAELTTNENHINFLDSIKGKNIDDFNAFKKTVRESINTSKTEAINLADKTLKLIHNNGLSESDFNRGTLYKHFAKIKTLDASALYKGNLEKDLEEGRIIKKSNPKATNDTILSILEELNNNYKSIKALIYTYKFNQSIYINLTPLSLLNIINQEVNKIKEEDNKMLISEFNTLISNEIKNQPTPFIYERIGEKFSHYFIDEFQDTSELQWENLQPLIENTLAAEDLDKKTRSALIVGDAKQAIYRWRGGKAEQFLGLINDDEPFTVPKTVHHLENNYRSFENVIDFNNRFFEYTAQHFLQNPEYAELYKNAKQNTISKQKGSVVIKFLEYKNKQESEPLYSESVLEYINTCKDLGYKLQDICVLVRKNKEAELIANLLGENNIAFTSQDSLLLTNSDEVLFLNNLLTFLVNPKDLSNKFLLLDYLAGRYKVENKHQFFAEFIPLSIEDTFNAFVRFNINSDPTILKQLSLYDLAEKLVRDFKLIESQEKSSHAYIQFYLDAVLEFAIKTSNGVPEFIDYFETNANKLKIATSTEADAVKIMTIHASKGLEFPIVIHPFADSSLHNDIKPKEWVPLEENKQGIEWSLLNYTKDFENFNPVTKVVHEKHQSELELDNLNVLYVALTRPVEKLFIITKKSTSKTKKHSNIPDLLEFYLTETEGDISNQEEVTLGKLEPKIEKETKEEGPIYLENQTAFISTPKESHEIAIITNTGEQWFNNTNKAINRGNLIHETMAKVKTSTDIDNAVEYMINSGEISKKEKKELTEDIKAIVNHPELKQYFSKDITVYNEQAILSPESETLIPDRIVIENNTATIIDYKTGKKEKSYAFQLEKYENALKKMNFTVSKKILVYINENITIEEV